MYRSHQDVTTLEDWNSSDLCLWRVCVCSVWCIKCVCVCGVFAHVMCGVSGVCVV